LRESLRVVTAGHVDHGKSTVIGRLLADSGALPDGKLERVKAYCEKNSRPFEYAFLLDALKDEQSQGITIEAARIFFKTPKRDYILIDAPGHIEFLKNMVTGAATAAAALLVIDAKEGVCENSRRHGHLLSLLGVRQIAVLINKMDLVGYRKEEFERLRSEFETFLKSLGIKARYYIPVSGLGGDNVASASKRMSWYRGPTILGAIESFEAERPVVAGPLRLPVQDVYKFTRFNDARRIVCGRVESGKVSVGDEIVFHPSGKSSIVSSIETFPPQAKTRARAGEAVGLTLKEQIYVRRGELATLKKGPAPTVGTRLKANVFWLGKEPLSVGKSYVLKLATARRNARLEKIERALDASTLQPSSEAREVMKNCVATCVFNLDFPLAFDVDAQTSCGRFVLIDDYEISGGGLIESALPDPAGWVREKISLRNAKWQKSDIPAELRERMHRQKAGLVLVTGRRRSKRKEAAKALESSLFKDGRQVYFLAIGSVLYGIDADLRGESANHPEDIRRLAELAHIMIDAGMILIVSAVELGQADLEIIRAIVEPEQIETVWIGEGKPEFECGLTISGDESSGAAEAIKNKLLERGWISRPGER
jgi:bifunctional enzyme CysN/CysC